MVKHTLCCLGLWILVGGVGPGGGGLGDCPSPSTRPAERLVRVPDRLKVVTYNVLGCRGGMDGIIVLLGEQKADIIFLQEVGRGGRGGEDQAVEIARGLGGMHVVSASTLDVPAGQQCDEAILSRFTLCDGALHTVEESGRAYAVGARVKWRGEDLHLLSVHTAATGSLEARHLIESSQERLAQVSHLLEVVRGLEGDVIVAGDFNAAPWMPEYYGLTRLLTDFGSVNDEAKLTYPAGRPMVRIDYVFGRGELIGRSYEVLGEMWSDHRAVVASLGKSQEVKKSKSQHDRGTPKR